MKTKVIATAVAFVGGMMIAGCTAPAQVGVGKRIELPKDSAATCTSLCEQIGLGLDSVVVMASNVGCVCRAPSAPGAPAASSAGGMAAILIQEAEAAAAAQRQRSQQAQPPPRPPTTR